MEGKTERQRSPAPSGIIVHEKAVIHWVKEFPFEQTEAWGEALRDNIPKTRKAILKAVPDDEAFQEKIGKPTLENLDKMLPDGFVSKKGLPKEVILAKVKAKLEGEDAAKNYKKKVRRGFKNLDQGERNRAKVNYHLGKSFGSGRFKEAIENALGWLLPFIQPGQEGEFKSKFGNQVKRSGMLISDCAYNPEFIKPEDDKLNDLINQYISKDIVPFTTGGESHCDFGLILNSVRPFDSKEVKEIIYETYKYFYGEAYANNLRRTWSEKDYQYPLNPDEYIGHPDKPAYFDMALDIQVSVK